MKDRTISSLNIIFNASRVVSEDPTWVFTTFWFPANCPIYSIKEETLLDFSEQNLILSGPISFRGFPHIVKFKEGPIFYFFLDT